MPIALASRNDQAAGLRRMFAGASPCFVPVVSNPHIGCGGVLLERLSTALVERGARVLVVDAGERASAAGEMALVDLAQCVEKLSPQVSYLTARGLAIRFVDASGSTRRFLERVADAAPECDAVIVHAPASELCRSFGHGRQSGIAFLGEEAPCPIVFAEDRPVSVTHAYAAMKL
ncbi:MAG TPA: flagellar biosynthesis protein, partial [Caldimonas sp.]|nr:flagellar biosynthesis protein [Caldimonas sp.]